MMSVHSNKIRSNDGVYRNCKQENNESGRVVFQIESNQSETAEVNDPNNNGRILLQNNCNVEAMFNSFIDQLNIEFTADDPSNQNQSINILSEKSDSFLNVLRFLELNGYLNVLNPIISQTHLSFLIEILKNTNSQYLHSMTLKMIIERILLLFTSLSERTQQMQPIILFQSLKNWCKNANNNNNINNNNGTTNHEVLQWTDVMKSHFEMDFILKVLQQMKPHFLVENQMEIIAIIGCQNLVALYDVVFGGVNVDGRRRQRNNVPENNCNNNYDSEMMEAKHKSKFSPWNDAQTASDDPMWKSVTIFLK